MRSIIVWFLALFLTSQAQLFSQSNDSYRLAGIINVPPIKQAIITSSGHSWRLSGNERDGNIEIMDIDPVLATARVRLSSTNETELRLKRDSNLSPANLMFDEVTLSDLLLIYEVLSRKTLLRGSAIPASSFTFNANAATYSEAAAVIEKAMAEKGVAVIQAGEHFAAVIPEYAKEKIKIPPPPAVSKNQNDANAELLPAGVINFRNIDVNQVALILAQLKNQKVDAANIRQAPQPVITLRTTTSIDKAEAIYAIETVLLLHGIRVVDDGSGWLKMEPRGK